MASQYVNTISSVVAVVCYQLVEGVETEIDIRYKLLNDSTYGFEIYGDYIKAVDLIIDPVVLEWSTFVSGTGTSDGYLFVSPRIHFPILIGKYNGSPYNEQEKWKNP